MEDWKKFANNPFEVEFQLRLSDTDSLGHISNVSYVEYLETLRTEWHSHVRNNRNALEEWDWILGGINIKFRKESYLSDNLTGYMWCSHIGTKSWQFSYVIVNQNDEVILEASTSQIAFDYEMRRSFPIPTDIKLDLGTRLGQPSF